MSNFKVISDSSCDIPKKLLKEYDIELVPFYVSFDGKNYYKEYEEITLHEFYKKLTCEKIFPKTSLPSIQDYSESFRKYLENEQDIICFTLTSKFSGSYQSAINAKELLKEEFPKRNIIIFDSATATIGQGFLVIEACKMRNCGFNLNETFDKCKEIKNNINISLTLDTLEYLQKGGRIGKVSALTGSLFNIKPIILVKYGELIPESKVRGRKKAINRCLEITDENLKEFPNYKHRFIIVQSECLEEATELKNIVAKRYSVKEDIPIVTLGTTIGSHIGPSVIAIAHMPIYTY